MAGKYRMTKYCRLSLMQDCYKKTGGLIPARRLFMKRLAWTDRDWYGNWLRDSQLWEKLAGRVREGET